MSSWEPKAIGNPIDKLIASQMDEESMPTSSNNNHLNASSSCGKTNTNSGYNPSTTNGQQPFNTSSGQNESSSSSSLSTRGHQTCPPTGKSSSQEKDPHHLNTSPKNPQPSATPGTSIPLLSSTTSNDPKARSAVGNMQNSADAAAKIISNLWNIPDKGTFRNPYFGGKKEAESSSKDKSSNSKSSLSENGKSLGKENNSAAKQKDGKLTNTSNQSRRDSVSIPFLDDGEEDTESINEATETDESDESPPSPGMDIKVKDLSISGQETKMKEEKPSTTTIVQDVPESKVAVNSTNFLGKEEPFSEKIPGLGSPTMPEDIEMAEPIPVVEIKPKLDESIKTNKEEKDEKLTDEAVKNGEEISSASTPAKKEETDKVADLGIQIKKEEPSESTITQNGSTENGKKVNCIRIGCCNEVVDDPDWDYEFCSAKCAVAHCKTAFQNWVQTRRSES